MTPKQIGLALTIAGGISAAIGMIWGFTGFYADQWFAVMAFLVVGVVLMTLGQRMGRRGAPTPDNARTYSAQTPAVPASPNVYRQPDRMPTSLPTGSAGIVAMEAPVTVASAESSATVSVPTILLSTTPVTASAPPPPPPPPAAMPSEPVGIDAERLTATDPTADLAVIAEIAYRRDDLRAAVASNPALYPDLVAWLGSLSDPTVGAALDAAAPSRDRWATAGAETTSGETLAALAYAHPELRQRIAANPAAYDDLKAWIVAAGSR